MERQEIAFEVMLGSAEKANALLNELSDKAEKSPFGIIGITDTAKQLIAFGIEAEKVSETIDNLGDIATGVNVPIARLGLVYGQVKTAGRLMAQDLNQFTQAGVPLIKELSKVLNIAEKEVKELGSQGEISFEDVEQAIKNMTSEGGQFYKMMSRGNDTVLGQFDEFGDVIARTMMALGKPFESVVKNTTKKVVGYFRNFQETIEENEDAIREWAEGFIDGVSTAFSVIKDFASFFVEFFSNKFVQLIGGAVIAIKGLRLALTLLSKHPFILGLTALATGVSLLKDKFEGLNNSVRKVADSLNRVGQFAFDKLFGKTPDKIEAPKMTIRPELKV
jgi:tape measure domain-containing protein